jgi:hypothetical protein
MKTANVNKFCDRLDEIFEQGDPTKAQIIDAFNKFSGQSVPEILDEEVNVYFSNNYNCLAKSTIKIPAMSRSAVLQLIDWYKSELAKKQSLKLINIPPECRECGKMNSENCNTCKVLNPQFDGC